MKKLTSLLLAVLGAITVSAQPQPPILRNEFTTNTPPLAKSVVTNIVNSIRTNTLPFLVVTNHGVLNDGVDHVVELQALHEAYKDRGAIVFFPDGTNYVINGARFHMPTNTGVTPPQQAPFYWIGAGSQRKGQSVGASGGTIINWGFTNGPYKVFSGGLGRWKLSGITHRIQTGREANWFMLSTFTTLDWDDFALIGATSGSNALARWIRFGTDQPVENYTDWSTNANAQGYGTIMRDWYADKSRTIFELRDAANNYRFQRGFAGHGMGGDKMFIMQTNGPGGIVDILFDGLGIEGTTTTNIFYMDGVSVATFRDIGIYDPVIASTAYVATASSSALKVEDGFVDNGFRKFNVPSRFDIRTSVSGATNHTRNYWEFNSTMTVRASVPIAYIHSDGSYTYWQVNDNGVTQYFVDSLGSAVEQHRWLYAGSTVTLRNEGFNMMKEISAPGTPASGYGSLYAKTDGKVYWKDDAGTETDLTASGSGTPGGSSLQVQYNTNSTFAGDAGLTYDPVTDALTAGSFLATGSTTDGHIAFTNLTGFWTAFAPTNATRNHTNVWETWPVEPTQVFVPKGTNGGRVHWQGTPVKIDANGTMTGVQGINGITGQISQDTGTGTADLGATTVASLTTSLGSNTFAVIAPGGILATGIIGSGLSYDAATKTLSASGGGSASTYDYTNALNWSIWIESDHLTGFSDGDNITNFTAMKGGVVERGQSTVKYKTAQSPSGKAGMVFASGANDYLISVNSVLTTSMQKSAYGIAVLRRTNENASQQYIFGIVSPPASSSSYAIGFNSPFNKVLFNHADLSDTATTMGYNISSMPNGPVGTSVDPTTASYFVVDWKWNGTNLALGNGLEWDQPESANAGILGISGQRMYLGSFNTLNNFSGALFALGLATNVPSDGARLSIAHALYEKYLGGDSTNSKTLLIFTGDSMLAGTGLSNHQTTAYKTLQLVGTNDFVMQNFAVASYTFSNDFLFGQIAGNGIQKPPGQRTIVIDKSGRNDEVVLATKAGELLQQKSQYGSNLYSQGIIYMPLPMPPTSSGNSTYVVMRQKFNNWLSRYYQNFAAAMPDMRGSALWNDSTNNIFYLDLVHPSEFANDYEAGVIAQNILSGKAGGGGGLNFIFAEGTLNFASQTVGGSEDLPITVPGAANGDIVIVSTDTAVAGGIVGAWSGYASNNTAYVRFVSTGTAQNPASGLYNVRVEKAQP